MSLTAIECPDGVCHSHHGGHSVSRDALQSSLRRHGVSWCERLAERVYEISVDSFSQSVAPNLQHAGWQRRHLDWEFRLADEASEPERTLVDGALNAVESFLRSREVQRLFVDELVHGTLSEAGVTSSLHAVALQRLIEHELLAMLQEQREGLLDRVAQAMFDQAGGQFQAARAASESALQEVERMLVHHAEASR
ncbi:MAG: EF-1 guanine nucleotide exchange domain-containing protein [Cyanobacteriota bacterium]|nr:EF-1 guanine nucleotide exchange domain-containing protein [Cyanobacteriota bacterium]